MFLLGTDLRDSTCQWNSGIIIITGAGSARSENVSIFPDRPQELGWVLRPFSSRRSVTKSCANCRSSLCRRIEIGHKGRENDHEDSADHSCCHRWPFDVRLRSNRGAHACRQAAQAAGGPNGLQARGNGQKHEIVGRRLRCRLRAAWCRNGGNALFARARF